MIIGSRWDMEQPVFTFGYSVCRFSRLSHKDSFVNVQTQSADAVLTAAF